MSTTVQLRPVVHAFSAAALRDICERADFASFAPRIDVPGKDRFYHYRDNGSQILGVAHLDTVQRDRSCEVVDTAGGLVALSGALDDRLGAYVILDLLPRLGITVDWLLTTDEERGESTAADFAADKAYNWMFSFDRGGTDVVMYQYETLDLAARVREAGARVGVGSYSDICSLEQLGCAGLNWGVGYREYHSRRSHAWLVDTFKMVDRFVDFYGANADTHLDFDGPPLAMWEDDDWCMPWTCPSCTGALIHGFCPECDIDWLP